MLLSNIFNNTDLGNQFYSKTYNQKLHPVEDYDRNWKHKFRQHFDPFPDIMFTALKCSLLKFLLKPLTLFVTFDNIYAN